MLCLLISSVYVDIHMICKCCIFVKHSINKKTTVSLWWFCMAPDRMCLTVHIPQSTSHLWSEHLQCVLMIISSVFFFLLMYYEFQLDLKSWLTLPINPLKMCSIELALPNLCPYFVFQLLVLNFALLYLMIFSSVGT